MEVHAVFFYIIRNRSRRLPGDFCVLGNYSSTKKDAVEALRFRETLPPE